MTCVWNAGAGRAAPPPPGPSVLAGAALRLAFGHYRALLASVAVVLVPSLVLGAAALGYWRSVGYSASPHRALGSVAEVVGLAVVVLGASLAQAAGVHAATGAYVGASPDWRQSVRAATARWRDVGGAAIAVGVLSTIGLALFVVPGVVLWCTWFVAMPVVVMEGARARGALSRSAYLVAGRRVTILVAYVLVELVVLVCSLPVGALVGGILSHSALAQVVGEQVAVYSVEILLTPLQVALVVVVYLDERHRRDGVAPTEVARSAGILLDGTAPPGSGASDGIPPTGGRYPVGPAPEEGSAGGREVASSSPAGARSPAGWTALSPKPSPDRPREGKREPSWPGVSPKPPPPIRRAAPPVPPPAPVEGSRRGDDLPHVSGPSADDAAEPGDSEPGDARSGERDGP